MANKLEKIFQDLLSFVWSRLRHLFRDVFALLLRGKQAKLTSLFCGEPFAGWLLMPLFLDQAEWYYKNNRPCHRCWISEVRCCQIVEKPQHGFVLLQVHCPDARRPVGHIYMDHSGERDVPITEVASLWKITVPSSLAAHSQLASGPSASDPHRAASSVESLTDSRPSSLDVPQNTTAVTRLILLNGLHDRSSGTRRYKVLARIPLAQHTVFLRHVLAAGWVVSRSEPLRVRHEVRSLWFASMVSGLLGGDTSSPLLETVPQQAISLDQAASDTTATAERTKVADTVQRLRSSYEGRIAQIAALIPDVELEQVREEAEAREREAQEQRCAAEARLEEARRRTQAAETRLAAQDEEIARLRNALVTAIAASDKSPT